MNQLGAAHICNDAWLRIVIEVAYSRGNGTFWCDGEFIVKISVSFVFKYTPPKFLFFSMNTVLGIYFLLCRINTNLFSAWICDSASARLICRVSW